MESREKVSGGYKTTEELQGSKAFEQSTLNVGDLAHPVAGWTVRIYTSADRKHYLISAESVSGVSVYSDERGVIRTATVLQ